MLTLAATAVEVISPLGALYILFVSTYHAQSLYKI